MQRHWPGDDDAAGADVDHRGGAAASRCAWPTWRRSGAHSVNGVAELHTDLVKRELLPDFYELWPERFNNKTNGVTPRRWLLHANPRLTQLLTVAHRLELDRSAGAVAAAGADRVHRR